jgi:hypothetical protein
MFAQRLPIRVEELSGIVCTTKERRFARPSSKSLRQVPELGKRTKFQKMTLSAQQIGIGSYFRPGYGSSTTLSID